MNLRLKSVMSMINNIVYVIPFQTYPKTMNKNNMDSYNDNS